MWELIMESNLMTNPEEQAAYEATRTLSIVQWPEEILKKICEPVADIEIGTQELLDLTKAMVAALGNESTGVGIAAPQLGIDKRIILVNLDDAHKEPTVMINPIIQELSGKEEFAREGCLSMPGVFNDVSRPDRVCLSWINAEGIPFSTCFNGFNSRIIQHESDHLDGKMFFDRMPRNVRRATLRDWEKKQKK
jgi:peptide deformylase